VADPVSVGPAAASVVVTEKVGFTNIVALLSQLKHAVSRGKSVSIRVVAVFSATADMRVASSGGIFKFASAFSPAPIFADGTIFVRFGKMCDRSSFAELENVSGSHWALMPLRAEMFTERAGRSRNTPAVISPSPDRMLTPRRTWASRPRFRIREMPSEEAENGVAAMVDCELETTVNKMK